MTKDRVGSFYKTAKDSLGYKNVLQSPRLVKVVVSVGSGSVTDKKKVEVIQDRLAKITGQKAAPRPAKKSIASFKIREGDVVGFQITLRGKRMYDFLDRLIHIALPRTRDFRGLSKKAVDEMGNYTIGIREHTIFPETSDEDLKDIFGLAITIVTTAKKEDEALKFLEHIGIPFRSEK